MNWWQHLTRRSAMEEQLDRELSFHLDQHVADLIARGHTPAEARRLARQALGGPDQVKERCRDARGTLWLDDLRQDFRYAVRALRRKPGFAAVALLTLALGTGATTVMFTVIDGVLLKPLPYSEPDRLVHLQEQTDYSNQYGNLWAFTYPNFLDCQSGAHSLTMAAYRFVTGTLSRPGNPEHIDGRQITAGLFPMLGIRMARGRDFLAEEDRPGAPPVAIISYALWQRRFAGRSDAIGTSLVFDGNPYTVVGVAPARFRLDDEDADIFTLAGQDPSPLLQNRGFHRFQVWARLRPRATLAQARAELAAIGQRLAEQFPQANKGRTFIADPLRPDVDNVRSTLWLLLGAVTLVLLIACTNIASLLLARAVSREREVAMRVALGAGRLRLVRQYLTESLVLGLSGGVLGVLLAAAGLRPFLAFWPGTLPRAEQVELDWRVLLFALAASLLCGIVFGLAPALRVPSRHLETALRQSARTVGGASRRLHAGFVVAEIALAVVLLVSAGMLGRTMIRLSALASGINVRNVLTARMALSPAVLADPGKTRAAWQELLDRARRVPGVQAIAMVDTVPMRPGSNPIPYRTGPTTQPVDQLPLTLANSVTPDYLKVTGLRLLEGRFFDGQDRLGNQSVVVIDEVMAQQAFPGQDAVGKHVWIGLGNDPATVVGVVAHVRYWGPAGDDRNPVRAQTYYPFAQVPDPLVRRWSELMSVAVRTGMDPMAALEPLQREVRGATGDQVLYEVRTLEDIARSTLARQRFLLLLFGIFAALALLLACIGIYGVLAYLTSQRVPEIGVRMALGATTGQVMWLVLRQSLTMILLGIATGAAASLAAARFLESGVEGLQPNAPSTFAIMLPVLLLAALAASFFPARRASRVDPVKALHVG